MIRAILDTNVLVSGLLSPAGKEALVLQAATRGFLSVFISPDIMDEYALVLARPKFRFAPTLVSGLMARLSESAGMVDPTPSALFSPDPSDTKFLWCATAARADCIVTGNKRDFPDAPYGSIQVVSAGELLQLMARAL